MPHVHLVDFEAANIAAATEALGADFVVTSGAEAPGDTTILVSGRPSDEAVAQPALETVIVPFAGIPPSTLEQVRARPGLKLYNLHHNDMATAELAVGLLLDCARQIALADRRMREGIWQGRQEVSSAFLLAGRKAMIYGYGHIGRQIGRVLEALGMEVVGARRRRDPEEPNVFGLDDWRTALLECHVLVVAAPLTDETKGAIGAGELAMLQYPRLVVNIGRGPIIDERALYEACRNGVVGGAGIDVWYRYPNAETPVVLPSEFPFQDLDNVVMSPHTAGSGDTTEPLRVRDLVVLIRAIAAGENPRSVDLSLGY